MRQYLAVGEGTFKEGSSMVEMLMWKVSSEQHAD